jgi:uncharacterized protein (TIGR00369 family)
MSEATDLLATLRAVNAKAAFNRWLALEVIAAGEGFAEIRCGHRDDATQYQGFLHAAVIGGLIDTACGFAAATVAGSVLASHFSVNCLAPAVGTGFVARGEIVRAGKRQIFTRADLFAETDGVRKLVANGEALLLRAT